MDFEYKGGNCVVINVKGTTLVIDGKLSALGLKDVTPSDAIEIATQAEFAVAGEHVTISMPGEYEVSNISILGIPAKRLIDADNSERATMYQLRVGDVVVGVLGHVMTPLSDEQLEALGMVDVLIVPIGGGGYTLDSHQAVEVINKIDPRVIIPTHYADAAITYEVPQEGIEAFLKELGAPHHEPLAKWKLKGALLPEARTVLELTRTA